MYEAEKVIPMDESLVLKEFDIQEITETNLGIMKDQILEIPEMPEDREQYGRVKDMHIQAKKLLPRIEERRKELKAPVLKKGKLIDATAKKAMSMVQPLIEMSGSRRQAWEDIKAKEKAEKERQEQARLEAIENLFAELDHLCKIGLQYNRSSEDISRDLAHIEAFEISAVDFQEKTEDAERVKAQGIADTEKALKHRLEWEEQQAEQARIKAEQEEEAKRLAETKAAMEAEQKAREEKARIKAEAEAEKLRKEREALEAEKRRLEAEKQARLDAIRKEKQFNRDHAEAIEQHELYLAQIEDEIDLARAEAAERWKATERAKAEALEREKLIGPDKMMIQTVVCDWFGFIGQYKIPVLNTADGNSIISDFIDRMVAEIQDLKQAGASL